MAEALFARDQPEPFDIGWSQVPHGLWTAPLPTGAKVLLGWLHSHSNSFLAGLSMNDARRAMSSSAVAPWFEALEEGGFVRVRRGADGYAAKITLLMAPWGQLCGERQSSPQPRRNRRAETGAVGAPDPARIEDHVEDQPSLAQLTLSVSDSFDAFWEVWPKRVGKRAALLAYERALRRAADDDITAGARNLAVRWMLMTEDERRYVPYPERWLNGDRWLDDVPLAGEVDGAPAAWVADAGCLLCHGDGWVTIEGTNDMTPCACRQTPG